MRKYQAAFYRIEPEIDGLLSVYKFTDRGYQISDDDWDKQWDDLKDKIKQVFGVSVELIPFYPDVDKDWQYYTSSTPNGLNHFYEVEGTLDALNTIIKYSNPSNIR